MALPSIFKGPSKVLDDLSDISKWGADWDGEGASEPDTAVLAKAATVLPALEGKGLPEMLVFPTTCGRYIEAEFKNADRFVIVRVGKDMIKVGSLGVGTSAKDSGPSPEAYFYWSGLTSKFLLEHLKDLLK